MIASLILTFAAFAGPPQTATLTVCNTSDTRLSWISVSPPTSGTSEPVPIGTCITVPGITTGIKEVMFYYGTQCVREINVESDMTITFDQALNDACDEEERALGEAMWGDE